MRIYKYNQKIEDKLVTILKLAYKINCETGYAVFLNFSGHVNSFGVEVSKSKERFYKKLINTDFYLEPFDENDKDEWKKIETKLDNLIDNLKNYEIKKLKVE